jgi:hypothetical protein
MPPPRKYFTDEERREAQRRWTRVQNQKRKTIKSVRWRVAGEHLASSVSVPHEVWEERDRALASWQDDPTAAVCGDPLPGRSALDRRR